MSTTVSSGLDIWYFLGKALVERAALGEVVAARLGHRCPMLGRIHSFFERVRIESILIEDYTNTYWAKLAMGNHRLVAGVVSLGWNAASRGGGKLDLGGGVHSLASIAKSASSDAAENAVEWGHSRTRISTSVDGTTIAMTASRARITGAAALVSNVNLTAGYLQAWGCRDGGGNSKRVRFAPTRTATSTGSRAA